MHNGRKIISSLFLTLAGSAPLLFAFMISIEKQHIRKDMLEEMENGPLQTIHVYEKNVQWMDKHEIWVNNKMFDIHSKSLEDGIYTFTGLYDEKETILVELEKNTGSRDKEQTSLLTSIFNCIPGFFMEQKEWFSPKYTNQFPSYLSLDPFGGYCKVITPPPRA